MKRDSSFETKYRMCVCVCLGLFRCVCVSVCTISLRLYPSPVLRKKSFINMIYFYSHQHQVKQPWLSLSVCLCVFSVCKYHECHVRLL